MNAEQDNYQRVIWQSRRGMLELDLVLEPYVKRRYPELDAAEQADYRALLCCEDQELFDWLMKKARPSDARHAATVDRILHYQAHRDLSDPLD